MSMTATKERPILFSGPMVNAIRSGLKTQTRRIVKGVNRETEMAPDFTSNFPQHGMDRVGYENGHAVFEYQTGVADTGEYRVRCPYGQPGDRLWVRETWALVNADEDGIDDWVDRGPIPDQPPWPGWQVWHRAGHSWAYDHPDDRGFCWRPSIHMPRWASRLTLEITGVRVGRLNDISEEDARAEGVGPGYVPNSLGSTTCVGCRPMFARVWRDINGPGSWDRNDWVWVIEFRKIDAQGVSS